MNYRKQLERYNLGIDRKDMPQIDADLLDHLVLHYSNKDVRVRKSRKHIHELRPTQAAIDESYVRQKMDAQDQSWKERQYVISSDNYIVDGHHAWAQGMEENPDQSVRVIRVALPIRKLLARTKRLGFVRKPEEYLLKADTTEPLLKVLTTMDDTLTKGGPRVPIGTVNKHGKVKTANGWVWVKKDGKGGGTTTPPIKPKTPAPAPTPTPTPPVAPPVQPTPVKPTTVTGAKPFPQFTVPKVGSKLSTYREIREQQEREGNEAAQRFFNVLAPKIWEMAPANRLGEIEEFLRTHEAFTDITDWQRKYGLNLFFKQEARAVHQVAQGFDAWVKEKKLQERRNTPPPPPPTPAPPPPPPVRPAVTAGGNGNTSTTPSQIPGLIQRTFVPGSNHNNDDTPVGRLLNKVEKDAGVNLPGNMQLGMKGNAKFVPLNNRQAAILEDGINAVMDELSGSNPQAKLTAKITLSKKGTFDITVSGDLYNINARSTARQTLEAFGLDGVKNGLTMGAFPGAKVDVRANTITYKNVGLIDLNDLVRLKNEITTSRYNQTSGAVVKLKPEQLGKVAPGMTKAFAKAAERNLQRLTAVVPVHAAAGHIPINIHDRTGRMSANGVFFLNRAGKPNSAVGAVLAGTGYGSISSRPAHVPKGMLSEKGKALAAVMTSEDDTAMNESTFYHEFGHYLDCCLLPAKSFAKRGMRESYLSELDEYYVEPGDKPAYDAMKDLIGSLQSSAEVQKIKHATRVGNFDSKFAKYLLEPKEIFARAFEQYVATVGDYKVARMKQESQGESSGVPCYWDDAYFRQQIVPRFQNLFIAAGWQQ